MKRTREDSSFDDLSDQPPSKRIKYSDVDVFGRNLITQVFSEEIESKWQTEQKQYLIPKTFIIEKYKKRNHFDMLIREKVVLIGNPIELFTLMEEFESILLDVKKTDSVLNDHISKEEMKWLKYTEYKKPHIIKFRYINESFFKKWNIPSFESQFPWKFEFYQHDRIDPLSSSIAVLPEQWYTTPSCSYHLDGNLFSVGMKIVQQLNQTSLGFDRIFLTWKVKTNQFDPSNSIYAGKTMANYALREEAKNVHKFIKIHPHLIKVFCLQSFFATHTGFSVFMNFMADASFLFDYPVKILFALGDFDSKLFNQSIFNQKMLQNRLLEKSTKQKPIQFIIPDLSNSDIQQVYSFINDYLLVVPISFRVFHCENKTQDLEKYIQLVKMLKSNPNFVKLEFTCGPFTTESELLKKSSLINQIYEMAKPTFVREFHHDPSTLILIPNIK